MIWPIITRTEHERELAAKDAEIAGLMACSLPHLACRVLDEMDEYYGYSSKHIAQTLHVSEKQVRAILRSFEAFGWANLHPFFSEDDNLIRGSGYSLNSIGFRAKLALRYLNDPRNERGQFEKDAQA
jgi:hypothetical protein